MYFKKNKIKDNKYFNKIILFYKINNLMFNQMKNKFIKQHKHLKNFLNKEKIYIV